MANLNIDLNDLTNAALKRLVAQLLSAKDGQEKQILDKLKGAPKNDLADLHEEQHGKPNTPEVEEDEDPFDMDAREGRETPKKGKK